MLLTKEEEKFVENILEPYKKHEMIIKLKEINHHGKVSIFDHCDHVAKMAFYMYRYNTWNVNIEDVIIGAFLHDFYLYDWHKKGDGTHKLHGFRHPRFAMNNASKYFQINDTVKNIIFTHMWPLTLFRLPKSKEALLVCLADKRCTLLETLYQWNIVKEKDYL